MQGRFFPLQGRFVDPVERRRQAEAADGSDAGFQAVLVKTVAAPGAGEPDVPAALDAGKTALGGDGGMTGLVGRTVADVERDLIIETLEHTLGNRTHAANILGISIRTLRNKLKLYTEQGFDVPSPGEAERPAI